MSQRVRSPEPFENGLDVGVLPLEGPRRKLEDRRAHRARADRHDADAVRRKIQRHRARQGMDRALGGDIGGNADLAGMPLNAGQVDDDATVTFPHSGTPYSAVRWIEPTLTAMQRMKVSNDVVSASP